MLLDFLQSSQESTQNKKEICTRSRKRPKFQILAVLKLLFTLKPNLNISIEGLAVILSAVAFRPVHPSLKPYCAFVF